MPGVESRDRHADGDLKKALGIKFQSHPKSDQTVGYIEFRL